MATLRSSTRKPAALRSLFEAWLADQGVKVEAIDPVQGIELFAAFHDEVPIPRRPQRTHADMLLFQTGHPSGASHWVVNVTRQLYSRGRGHQLGLSFEYRVKDVPWPGYVTLWSKDHAGIREWVEAAKQALETLRLDDAPVEVRLSLDAF